MKLIFAGSPIKSKLEKTGLDRIKEMAKNSVGSRGQCFTCGKVLNSRANAIRHFMLVHSKDQMSSEHPCPKCGKVFRTHNSARDHLRRTHKVYASNKSSSWCEKKGLVWILPDAITMQFEKFFYAKRLTVYNFGIHIVCFCWPRLELKYKVFIWRKSLL